MFKSDLTRKTATPDTIFNVNVGEHIEPRHIIAATTDMAKQRMHADDKGEWTIFRLSTNQFQSLFCFGMFGNSLACLDKPQVEDDMLKARFVIDESISDDRIKFYREESVADNILLTKEN